LTVANSAPLPTRCVDVSGEHLILRETGGSKADYLTLSHRWNSQTELYTTTTDNYEDRTSGRGFGELSKVFEDAIAVTRRLGFKYIWIDSLCIIQNGDDGRDWGIEAGKMAQYYTQSILTIAALTYEPSEGFLCPRKTPILTKLVQLPYRDPKGEVRGVFYIYKTEKSPEQRYWAAVRQSPLLKRGWIFQEWILSRRLLWFTPEGVFFDCQDETQSPITEFNERIDPINVDAPGQVQLKMKHNFQFSGTDKINAWYKTVETYSGSDLTRPEKDRIIAISGVARQFRDAMSIDSSSSNITKLYISGLWLDDLHHGLLWEQCHKVTTYERACEAPTWSWASLSAEVQWAARCPRVRNACEVGTISVVGTTHWPTDTSQVMSPLLSNNDDLMSMFTCLAIRGKILPVSVRGFFNEDELTTAAQATDHEQSSVSKMVSIGDEVRRMESAFDPKDSGQEFRSTRQNWRIVCPLKELEVIGGWGSFEHPHVFIDGTPQPIVEVDCLHVSTRAISSMAGWRFGYLNIHHPVLNVLYLQRINGRRYRRLGVGRIFEKDIITAFQNSKEQIIELE
jgi:hypothetical protein